MKSPAPGKRPLARRKSAASRPAENALVNRQMRKVLTQHYRAKHGVK
jgi:hypothetical protein